MNKKERAIEVFKKLLQEFPDAHCELNHDGPFQLLIATILSAQCTDITVNKVTPQLFSQYPSPKDLAVAPIEKIEKIIHSTGFFRNKAKNIVACAKVLNEQFGGNVPQSIDELSLLPGVGRKTANVVLSNCFNINQGIVVDTHVKRISQLLGLTKSDSPEKIEIELTKLFPQKDWGLLSHLLIFHGRRTCIARRPHCDLCSLASLCPSKIKALSTKKK